MNNTNCGVSVVRANNGNNFFTQNYITAVADSCTNTVYQYQNWELSNIFTGVIIIVLIGFTFSFLSKRRKTK